MPTFDAAAVVRTLVQARRSATAVQIPGDWRDVDLAAAYRMQRSIAEQLGAVRGWKISAVTAAQQLAAGLEAPVAAPLLEPWFVRSGATLVRAAFCKPPLLECEYAFALGTDLPSRSTPYTRAEVEAAIAAVHIVLEVCDSRLAGSGSTLQQLVDDFNNGAFVLGPPCADWRGVDYANNPIVLRGPADKTVLVRGSAMAVLDGDPVGTVVLMANLQPPVPGGLRAGQVITTGSCTTPFPVTTDGEFSGDFGRLGRVQLRFAAAAAAITSEEEPQ